MAINWRSALLWRLLLVLPATGAVFGWPFGDASIYATNRDGSVLYFSSSLRMKGTTQYLHPKTFVWEAGESFRLFEERAPDAPAEIPPAGWVGSEYFSLDGVDVSSDGSTVSLVGRRVCTSTACATLERYQTSIYAPGQTVITMPGVAALSRNGRYAVLSSSISTHSPLPPPAMVSLPVVDLQTGQRTNYSGWDLSSGRSLANDGTLLLSTAAGLALARGGQTTALNIPSYYGAWINDAATLVFYWANSQLLCYSVATRTSTVLASPVASALVSDDGSVIVFSVSGGSMWSYQIYAVHSDGTGLRRLTNVPADARLVAMSGDGRFVFAFTEYDYHASGRLVRIDVASGESTEVIPSIPTPISANWPNPPWWSWWPGALATLWGDFRTVRETIEAQPPFPPSLAGIEIRINGDPAPIASVSPKTVQFQIPWDLPASSSELEVHEPNFDTSPFEVVIRMLPAPPEFFLYLSGKFQFIEAAHEGFDQRVSPANPARSGEIVHLYARGLGPVSPAPPPGESAPSDPLYRLTHPLVCGFGGADTVDTWSPIWNRADVLFAGLAPGMMGIYQIDLRLPATIIGNPILLTCLTGDPAPGKWLSGYITIKAAAN